MKKYLFPLAGFLLLLCACAGEEMDRTVFIPDATDANLPAYTEWGYNSFGARYERNYFLVANSLVPCKVTYRDGVLNFSLTGRLAADAASNRYDTEKMTLTFAFPSSHIGDFTDLVSLHGREIDLTGDSCGVRMEREDLVALVRPVSGRLTFGRAQLLRIDDVINRVILSGTFEVKFLLNSRPETISDGRFDVGIRDDFYSYPE
ncbi:MAG: hypothetical protein LBT76_01515 [Tannerella sp.]|nr:hypothetical protein [Tannerella sp.]